MHICIFRVSPHGFVNETKKPRLQTRAFWHLLYLGIYMIGVEKSRYASMAFIAAAFSAFLFSTIFWYCSSVIFVMEMPVNP